MLLILNVKFILAFLIFGVGNKNYFKQYLYSEKSLFCVFLSNVEKLSFLCKYILFFFRTAWQKKHISPCYLASFMVEDLGQFIKAGLAYSLKKTKIQC